MTTRGHDRRDRVIELGRFLAGFVQVEFRIFQWKRSRRWPMRWSRSAHTSPSTVGNTRALCVLGRPHRRSTGLAHRPSGRPGGNMLTSSRRPGALGVVVTHLLSGTGRVTSSVRSSPCGGRGGWCPRCGMKLSPLKGGPPLVLVPDDVHRSAWRRGCGGLVDPREPQLNLPAFLGLTNRSVAARCASRLDEGLDRG